MFPRTVLAASIAAAAMSTAVAQDNTPPASRAEVKAETRAAEKAGRLTPAGEGAAPTEKVTTKSTKTRAQRKAETMQARKSGDLAPAGEAEDAKKDKELQSMHSTKTRAQRKADPERHERRKRYSEDDRPPHDHTSLSDPAPDS